LRRMKSTAMTSHHEREANAGMICSAITRI
jgi:hypothetical protein